VSVAGHTLKRARFLAQKAREAGPSHRVDLAHFLEAAIVFGRSVTFHLQTEYRRVEGFDDWYASKQDEMCDSDLMRFFHEKRTLIIHVGPGTVQKQVEVELHAEMGLGGDLVVARVIRAKPLYRRRPRILWQDLTWPVRQRFHQWRQRQAARERRKRSRHQYPKDEVRETLYFDDPKWRDQPAPDMLDEYLDRLAAIVAEAEKLFSTHNEAAEGL
jgi:hypothetical protein